jgi:tetratricopeptide (TPR) repeat protein
VPAKVKQPARSKWLVRAALAAIALVAYADSFWLGMAQDANVIVGQDPRLRAVTAENIGLILSKNYWFPLGGDGLYRPVTTLSLLFNYSVLGNGANAAGYHILNFLLHLINVWLLYELALLIFGRAGPAFFASAIWAVHPIGTEAVTSIVGRADLLAAMSVLGGLLLYIRGRGRWATLGLFVVATLGVFAKENAAVLVGIMLLWDLSFGEKPRWKSYAAVGVSLLLLVVVRSAVFSGLATYTPIYVDNPLRLGGFWAARFTAIKIVGLDLGLLLFPLTLLCDHSFAAITPVSATDSAAWLSLAAIVGILGLVILRRREDPMPFWAAGFFAITLLPTSNLIFLIGAALAERFLYLPAIGFAVALTGLLYRLRYEIVFKGILIAFIAVYAARTIVRNPDWDDDISLASADLPYEQHSFRLHYMMARGLFRQDVVGNIDRAIAEDEVATTIVGTLPPSRSIAFPATFLGQYYATKADLVTPGQRAEWLEKSRTALLQARVIAQAIEQEYDNLQRSRGALVARAADPQLYTNLANTDIKLERYQDAVEALRFAQGINPGALEVYDGLSKAYTALGQPSQAVVAISEKALIDRFQAATMHDLQELYRQIADGQCAFVSTGGGWQLNSEGCPRVKSNMCAAYGELGQAYGRARVVQGVEWARTAGKEQFGCPAP